MILYSGYKRSLKCSVTRKTDGVTDSGYPKTYPTTEDVANGYFTYNAIQYTIPSSSELASMSQSEYNSLLAAFEGYVAATEAGLNFTTDTLVQPTYYDDSACPIGDTDVTTTTTTQSPAESYSISSSGSAYGVSETLFVITGALPGDIVTVKAEYSGLMSLAEGYISYQAKLILDDGAYPLLALSNCYSDSLTRSFGLFNQVDIVAPASSFPVITTAQKINSTNTNGTVTVTIVKVVRDGVSFTVNKSAYGNHYKDMDVTFEC